MKETRRGFFRMFAAAAGSYVAPRATAAPAPAKASEVGGVFIHFEVDGRLSLIAKQVIRELPRELRAQGLA